MMRILESRVDLRLYSNDDAEKNEMKWETNGLRKRVDISIRPRSWTRWGYAEGLLRRKMSAYVINKYGLKTSILCSS